ncbi:hypothetical protein FISHEDRAFT_8987, partial [Fistulina hepatica ATCC 64428]
KYSIDTLASDKLLADAAKEGTEEPRESATVRRLLDEHENWTGDERVEDTILRMLIDKYKPLRSGEMMSADQKLKKEPPRIITPAASAPLLKSVTTPSTGSWATEPLLPSIEGHRPWHTTYKAPSHVVASVRVGHFPGAPMKPTHPQPTDERARRKERERKKRTAQAGRLHSAKESTLDYQLGIGGSKSKRLPIRTNPISMKGWASLIEDQIEHARSKGLFNGVKGRGQPIRRNIEESNPFIAREDFLMNRIIQRNGASPPFVELQAELDGAVNALRVGLREAWTRRTVRMITNERPPEEWHRVTLTDVYARRDTEWEQRERAYHDAAIDSLNSLVRKYNGIAPYPVRRPYYERQVEIDALPAACADNVLRALQER